METKSGGNGKKSLNSRSMMKNKDEITILGHGSEVGGIKSPKKMKWDSTRQMSQKRVKDEIPNDDQSQSDIGDVYNRSTSQLQRQLINIHDVERFCKPQQLSVYNPVDSGLKYNIIGLFGIPERIDPDQPCVYTVLASVFPPGEPYK